MTDVEASYEGFIASRRSGRRNAIHDIPANQGTPGPTELSESLAQLSVNKQGEEGEDADKSKDASAKDEGPQSEDS